MQNIKVVVAKLISITLMTIVFRSLMIVRLPTLGRTVRQTRTVVGIAIALVVVQSLIAWLYIQHSLLVFIIPQFLWAPSISRHFTLQSMCPNALTSPFGNRLK